MHEAILPFLRSVTLRDGRTVVRWCLEGNAVEGVDVSIGNFLGGMSLPTPSLSDPTGLEEISTSTLSTSGNLPRGV